MNTYLLDAGHGGGDPGCNGFGVKEKDLTLEASLYIAKRLNQHGIKTKQTRTTDIELDSVKRTNIIKQSGATKGLSLHFNAFNTKARGYEFIHSIHSDGKFEELLKSEFAKSKIPFRRIFTRKNTQGTDYYFIHRLTGNVKMTIVEFAFLDNKEDFDLINTKAEREFLYEAVVKAVCVDEKVAYIPLSSPKLPVKEVIIPKPAIPSPSRGIYRVYVDNKQVGAFKDPLEFIEDLIKKGTQNIRIEKI
jgi:N-acetylmuramoyl-L-alanine amidase